MMSISRRRAASSRRSLSGHRLRAPQRITWRQVYRQFGVEPSRASDNDTVQKFRRKVLRELKKIKLAWPEVNYTTARGVLILLPSTPAIAPLNPGQPGS